LEYFQSALLVYDDLRDSTKLFINPYYTRRCIMIKRKALMESIASNLHGFLKKNSPKFVSAGQKIPA
jgi:hypothetical protein